MMRYKREEAFRYTFGQPEFALFQIVKIDGILVESQPGEGKLIDLSLEGARLNTILNMPEINEKKILLAISFLLNEKEFTLSGHIMWKKRIGTTFDYGIHFDVNDSTKQSLIDQLKIYSKVQIKQL